MKTNSILLVLLAFIGLCQMNAQVGIGTTTPDASSILDVESTDKGFLPPRLTSAQRDAIASPAEGLVIYNTDNNCLEFWDAIVWVSTCGASLVNLLPSSDCPNTSFTVVDVVAAGYTWMDRNLGATQAATSSTDPSGFGDLYQWGRCADGHQLRTSGTTTTNATTVSPNAGNPWDGLFILEDTTPFDWLQTQDNSLWQGVNGTNNPCPAGYRLPTEAELIDLNTSFATQDAAGAFGSPLRLPTAGYREYQNGSPGFANLGAYWSSTVNGQNAAAFSISTNNLTALVQRAYGFSVRCLKD
jgi:uncharacterized protein (TIGR02145 family)